MVCADNLFYADLHGIYSDICSLYYVKRGCIIFTMARFLSYAAEWIKKPDDFCDFTSALGKINLRLSLIKK